MEKFKAVEKEMKTKAYSKEGLSAAAKLDPKEKEKLETCQFLSSMVEEIERQVETIEAEAESLQANLKKGKKDTSKAERVAEIERMTERHKWHQTKLELILRSLENGGLETDQVADVQENIKYYVDNNQEVDFVEDDAIYDELHLDEEDDGFGMNNEIDRVSSQDTQSIQDDMQEPDLKGPSAAAAKPRPPSGAELPGAAARRPSTQMKSPLPALATLHTPLANTTNSAASTTMKPAPPPTRAPGETLKYASAAAAAAAAAASDKNVVGIAPLPPPSSAAPLSSQGPTESALPSALNGLQTSATSSPRAENSRLAEGGQSFGQRMPAAHMTTPPIHHQSTRQPQETQAQPPIAGEPGVEAGEAGLGEATQTSTEERVGSRKPESSKPPNNRPNVESISPIDTQESQIQDRPSANPDGSVQTNGNAAGSVMESTQVHESIYHLPTGLQDLLQSFETTKSRMSLTPSPSVQRLLAASHATRPDSIDADKPRYYNPQTRYKSPSYYPQEPFPLLDDPRLYSRIDTDTLFYVFYYCQGSYQQYMAAKSLKSQSWRFHKQYQTWFQRHEEPKTITEEYEQGTYRFFDYESTW